MSNACSGCGRCPCVNRSFCRACRRVAAAERKAGRQVRESASVLRARRLLADSISLERAWHELNDGRNHATPRATIEALMHCVRERGLAAALKDPENLERLSRCDAAARPHINKRIERLKLKEPFYSTA